MEQGRGLRERFQLPSQSPVRSEVFFPLRGEGGDSS